jgi:hypothetical protein
MINTIVRKFFSDEDLQVIKDVFLDNISIRGFENNDNCEYVDMLNVIGQPHLGRFIVKTQYSVDGVSQISLPESILKKVDEYVESNNPYDVPLSRVGASFVRYDKKYGIPNLGPHIDLGHTGVIVDFQLDSSTDWALGIDDEVYHLDDNSLVLFDALRQYHWRPEQEFEEDDFVSLIFFEYGHESLNQVQDAERLSKAEFVRDIYSHYLRVKRVGKH